MLALTGCGANMPVPTDIPIGASALRSRSRTWWLRERACPAACWNPAGFRTAFVLVNADFIKAGNQISSVDLNYASADHELHIWQTHLSPNELGESDPVPRGRPLEGTEWSANRLPAAQVGQDGVVEYAIRLDDGRTVTVDSDMDEETMRRVLESLRFTLSP